MHYFFKKDSANSFLININCRADWIRTSDPYVPNVVRYRAALLPDLFTCLRVNKSFFEKCPPSLKLRRTMSGGLDSNQRPLAPHTSALPGCATTRMNLMIRLQIYDLFGLRKS